MKKNMFVFMLAMALSTSAFAQEIGKPAPNIIGRTAEGEVIKLSDYKGKVVLLDFWASWCGPCKKEFPFLVSLHDKLDEKNFSVIGINVDTKIEKMVGFLEEQKKQPGFPIITDVKGKFPELYKVEGMPTTLLIDKKGIVRFRHTGFEDKEKKAIIAEVKKLL